MLKLTSVIKIKTKSNLIVKWLPHQLGSAQNECITTFGGNTGQKVLTMYDTVSHDGSVVTVWLLLQCSNCVPIIHTGHII